MVFVVNKSNLATQGQRFVLVKNRNLQHLGYKIQSIVKSYTVTNNNNNNNKWLNQI